MNQIDFFYKKVIAITCEVCNVDSIMMFSCKKEKYVDARNLVILNLITRGYTDNHISELTGLTRQAVNYIRNSFPDKQKHSCMLSALQQMISNELASD